MATVRELIVAAVLDALNAAGKPADVTVHRQRNRPIEQDSLPAILVYTAQEAVDEPEGDLDDTVERALTLRIEQRAKVASGQAPDTALDPLYAWTVQALQADPTFGGLAVRLWEMGHAWNMEERNVALAGSVTTFGVEFYTAASDPEESKA